MCTTFFIIGIATDLDLKDNFTEELVERTTPCSGQVVTQIAKIV